MKTLKLLTAAFVSIYMALIMSIGAQSFTLSNTTLSGAINGTQTTLVLASASASSGSSFGAPAVGQCLFTDRELMRITAVSSTTMTVQRDRFFATPHANAAVIFTGSCAAFYAQDPIPSGNVTCNTQPAPWVNTQNGNVWYCNKVNSSWTGTNAYKFTYNSVPVAQ